MIFGPGATNRVNAGWFRLRAIICLVGANVGAVLIPFLGPICRVGYGSASHHDVVATMLTLLVSFVLPSIPIFLLYLSRWPNLREEKIQGWQGYCMMWLTILTSVVAVGSLVWITVWADYELKVSDTGPLETNKPEGMSLESRVLYWYTGVAVLFLLSVLFGLMPIDPYKGQVEKPDKQE
jgi:hypothetical protein